MKISSICFYEGLKVPVFQTGIDLWSALDGNGQEFVIRRKRSRSQTALHACRKFWVLNREKPTMVDDAWNFIRLRIGEGRRVGAIQLAAFLRDKTPHDAGSSVGYKVPAQFGSMMLRFYLVKYPDTRRFLGIKGAYDSDGLPKRVQFEEDFLFDRRLVDVVPNDLKSLCVRELSFSFDEDGEGRCV